MTVDLARVRERMVDLEDHHEIEISVEEVLAELLGHDDPVALGRSVSAEVQRSVLLLSAYRRVGVRVNLSSAAGIGFLQGVTFAIAYRQIAEEA